MLNILSVCLILVLPLKVLCREQSNSESNRYVFLEKYGAIILNHISTLNDPLDQIEEYREYFNKMSEIDISSTSAVMLSFFVHQLMEVFPENVDLNYIIDNLPIEITKIPWARPVNIFNEETKNYLCADDEPLQYKVYSSTRRGVNCFWNLIIMENGRYFIIQNNAHYRYMYGSNEPSDADQQLRTISTSDNTVNITYLSDRWQFKPHRNDEKTIEYQIKNYLWNEYIMAQQIPNVFVGKFSSSDKNLYLWRLTTESRQLPIERENELSDFYKRYNGDSETAELLLSKASMSTTRLIEYVKLFELMKEYDGFYSVAGLALDHNVEQLLQEYPEEYDLIDMLNYFRDLWPPFPWNRRVTIQNYGDGKFLCRSNDNYKIVLKDLSNETCSWEFIIDPSESNFRIKAFSSDFYLIAEPKTFFDFGIRRIVLSNQEVDNEIDKWQLYYEESQNVGVHIKNVAWKEIFYSCVLSHPSLTSDTNCERWTCQWLIEEV